MKSEKFWCDCKGEENNLWQVPETLWSPALSLFRNQSFHEEVNDAGKKMNHLRQHTEQLWQVSTSESDTCEYQTKD